MKNFWESRRFGLLQIRIAAILFVVWVGGFNQWDLPRHIGLLLAVFGAAAQGISKVMLDSNPDLTDAAEIVVDEIDRHV